MNKSKTGRNDPCPCGSGKKYKQCCLASQEHETASSKAKELNNELKQALEDMNFDSLDEAQVHLDQMVEQRNQAAQTDFHGLSSEQIYNFLYFPFESPQLIRFFEPQAMEFSAPILSLFIAMAEGFGEQGVKPTARGNLPRQLSKDIAMQYLGEEGLKNRVGKINKEEDFQELNITRLVGDLAGLIRKYKGRYILSRECRGWLKRKNYAAIYLKLFTSFVREYNWGYVDGYPEFKIIQDSFLYTLYLLTCYGDAPRPHTFYEDCFLRAFPAVVNEVESDSYTSVEDRVRHCYTLRTMERGLSFLGLATIVPTKDTKIYERNFIVSKLPLLNAVVQFNLPKRFV